ncbi:MAG: CoA pyrophosphatase [Deltaproteobacteria bacterium]|nr:CoA pyrophosphatase [Deltaproteobacteria bacterium]MBW2070418.1 CoA pyrophosphatase [Deltaproteobacteria bacterium]
MLEKIRANLLAASDTHLEQGALRPAAVLCPLLFKDKELHFLLTKRTRNVKSHKGQISFPGGVRDRSDKDLQTTALREAHEEIGLHPRDVKILGALEPISTVTSGFLVYSFVGHIPYPYPFQLNQLEVSEILLIPLEFLSDSSHWSLRTFQVNNSSFEAYFVNYGDYLIWGATARILKIFLERNGISMNIRPKMEI